MTNIYSFLIEHEYEFAREILIILAILFITIVFIDVLKWKYYGRK